jgi:hypothetical protein
MLPLGVARTPRRYVDRRRDRTTVTRKSAPARIGAPSLFTAEPAATPLEAVIAAESPVARTRLLLNPETSVRRRPSGRAVTPQPTSTDASSDDSGDESDNSYSSFVLNLEKKDVLGADAQSSNWGPLDRTYTTPATSSDSETKFPDGILPTTYPVLKSHYEGELFRNSKLNAQLIIEPTKRPGQFEFMRPLFRWIHVENPEMNFGAFLVHPQMLFSIQSILIQDRSMPQDVPTSTILSVAASSPS